MPRWFPILAMAAALSCTQPLAAAETTVLPRTGDWVANFADDSCSLSRTFGTGRDSVLLLLRTYGPGGRIDVQVASRGRELAAQEPAVRFLPSAAEAKGSEFFRQLRGRDGWEGIRLPVDRPSAPASVTGLEVKRVFGRDLVLDTGSMAPVQKVLVQCEDDLMRSLGLDPAAHRSLSRAVVLDEEADWLKATAPLQRTLLDKGSTFQDVRLLVDETGKPYGCKVVAGAIDPPTEQRLCTLLLDTSRFTPALYAQGAGVKSFFVLELMGFRRTGID